MCSRHLSQPQTHEAGTPFPSFPQPLATTHLPSVSGDLPVPDISGLRICGLLCLASFTQQSVCRGHPWCAVSVLPSFLWFDDILLYGWTTSCSSTHPLMDICLYLLGFVNRATMNTLFMYLLEYLFSVLWGLYLRLELLGHMLSLVAVCLIYPCFPQTPLLTET